MVKLDVPKNDLVPSIRRPELFLVCYTSNTLCISLLLPAAGDFCIQIEESASAIIKGSINNQPGI